MNYHEDFVCKRVTSKMPDWNPNLFFFKTATSAGDLFKKKGD